MRSTKREEMMSRVLKGNDTPTRLETSSNFNFPIPVPEVGRYYAVDCRVNHDAETGNFSSHEAFLRVTQNLLVFWRKELPTAPTKLSETVNVLGETPEDPSIKYQLIDKVRYLVELPTGNVVWTSSPLAYSQGNFYIKSQGMELKIYRGDIVVVEYTYEALTDNYDKGVPKDIMNMREILAQADIEMRGLDVVYLETLVRQFHPLKMQRIDDALTWLNKVWKVGVMTGKLGPLPKSRLNLRIKSETLEIYPVYFQGLLADESFLFDEFIIEEARVHQGASINLPEVIFDDLNMDMIRIFLGYVYEGRFPSASELAKLMVTVTNRPRHLKHRMKALSGLCSYLGLKEYDAILNDIIKGTWPN